MKRGEAEESIAEGPGLTREVFLRLVEGHTRLTHPALCRELRTRETAALVAAWEAAEALAGAQIEPPFWACSWAGSQALSRFLLDHPGEARGRGVLDLGCGNGIAAIASLRAGAARAIANDIDPAALWMAELTGALNGVALDLSGSDLLGSPPAVGPDDLILVGDLFYAGPLGRRVGAWTQEAARRGARVLVGDPGRAYLPRAGLEQLAAYSIAVSREIESRDELHVKVYRLDPDRPGPC